MSVGNGLHFGGEKARRMSRNARRIAKRSTMDRLADALADGLTVREASERLGITYSLANATVQRMRARLGWQAV